MIINITPVVFDISGALSIRALPSSNFGSMIRRANRRATLDLGVAVNDFGYTDADRDMAINFKPTPETDETARYLVRTHSRVHVATREGFFVAIPQYVINDGRSTITLMIIEKLA